MEPFYFGLVIGLACGAFIAWGFMIGLITAKDREIMRLQDMAEGYANKWIEAVKPP